MKLAILTSALAATLPFASAFSLQLYDKQLYKTRIHLREGTLSQPCKNLGANSNKAESMKWDHSNGFTSCRVRIYDSGDCSGSPLGDSNYASWNVPNFSSRARNKVSSYKINCR